MKADLHVHSCCSADGESSIADYAGEAAQLGLAEVGFCEHADFDPRDRSCGTMQVALYDQEIASARSVPRGVRLRQGVEISFQASLAGAIGKWLAGHSWDYVVASVHLVDYRDGWAIVSERPAIQAYFQGHSARQAYLPYFEELLRAVESGLGDVLGHFDLVKRYGAEVYGPLDPCAFEDEVRVVLKALVARGMALEVNTSGLRQAPGETYPALTVLRWYREIGGEVVTIGSDAHHARQLASGLLEGEALVRAAGFRAIVTYEQRQARFLDLA